MTDPRRSAAGDEVPIRRASTVMLVRDAGRVGGDDATGASGAEAGLEVFTLQRVSSMAFAAGMTAFPGGGVDASDGDDDVPWVGPEPAWWAAQWHVDSDVAKRHVVAAVRELFEETGVLLAGDDASAGAAAPAMDPDAARLSVAAHERGLAEVLRFWGLPLRADLLRPWARWITPAGPPRRYDTYFFLAALPAGQRARNVTSEAAAGGWRRPAEVLRAAEAGTVGLMPPTVAMMTDLAEAGSVAELMAAPRVVEPVTPTVLTADGEVLRVRAGGREYTSRMRHDPAR